MSKKRKRFKKNYGPHINRKSRHGGKSAPSASLDNEILAYIFKEKKPVSLTESCTALEKVCPSKKIVQERIFDLTQRGLLQKSGKKSFIVDRRGKIFSGRVDKHQRGFGFVSDLDPHESARFLEKDPFLSVKNMGSCNHGDQVLIHIKRVRRDGRPEAEIITILERNSETLVGFFKSGKPDYVVPEDPRYPDRIILSSPHDHKVQENQVVLVQIIPSGEGGRFLQGKITEILGSPDNIDVQMRMVIEKHDLPHIFPEDVIKEAETCNVSEKDMSSRLDLRDLLHITIDGESAKDFDDAIYIERTDKGYRLYVSIADVSHYVSPGSALDQEAYLRGTSIYFPGRVIPMLPENLSNNICSLVPDQDRLTFTAILEFDDDGKLTGSNFSKSVICSKQRFTYSTVKKILIDGHEDSRQKHSKFLNMLETAEKLARKLLERRLQRGSIGFNIPEPYITLKNDGTINSIERKERNFAHQIIEEFMLAANEAVASVFSHKNLSFIYRIHEEPSQEKLEEFTSFAQSLGLELPANSGEPSWFGKVLDIVRGTPTEFVVNNLLLRTMQQARYSPDNSGHFGLAATDYTHFTSPIRRYPDLMVHRFLNGYLQGVGKKEKPATPLADVGRFLSSRERLAISADRDMTERLKIFFMQQFVGDTFDAIITGVGETSLYIELISLFISGIIEVEDLKGDYYLYDPKRYRMVGEISGRSYQIGATLPVTLSSIDHRRKKIYFCPADQ